MADLKLYIICVSITWFICHHRDMQKLHLFIFKLAFEGNPDDVHTELINYTIKSRFFYLLYELITCEWCVGSWTGMMLTIFTCTIYANSLSIVHVLSNMFICAILSVFVCSKIK